MHTASKTWTAALLLLGVTVAPAAASGHSRANTPTPAAVTRLLRSVNARQASGASRLFTSNAVLQANHKRWQGRPAIARWWRSEIAHGLHLQFNSPVSVKGQTVSAVLLWKDRGGCAKGCLEQVNWRDTGAGITQMQVTFLAPAPPSPPGTRTPAPPPRTVPPPPTKGPAPGPSPTIPT